MFSTGNGERLTVGKWTAPIRISHYDYEVEYARELGDGARDAECDYKTRTLRFTERPGSAEYVEIMFHEILHAIWDVQGLESKERCERVVRQMAIGLTLLLRDNPTLGLWLVAELCEGEIEEAKE